MLTRDHREWEAGESVSLDMVREKGTSGLVLEMHVAMCGSRDACSHEWFF